MVVSFYVRIIVYVGITLPAIPSVRIAKSRQFSMDGMDEEKYRFIPNNPNNLKKMTMRIINEGRKVA